MTVAMAPEPPSFPRAPSQTVWDAMTETERADVVASLPASMTEAELHPPEGDVHYDAKNDARDTLRTFFHRTGRRLYVAADLTVYYPDTDRFAPDVLAVANVDVHPRDTWIVSAEGKGLDWVLEVLVHGDRRKDLERNVVRYAELGIAEYFILDVRQNALRGYRLPSVGMRRYEAIVAQHGAMPSRVLGLDLRVEHKRLRFRHANAELLASREIIERLEVFAEDRVAAAEEAARRAEEETRLREEESRLREEESRLREEETRLREETERRLGAAEQRIAALLVEIERLRGS